MKKNIGISDRIVRFVITDLLLGASLAGMDIPPSLSTLIFFGALLTGVSIVTAYSPIYHILGIDTQDESERKRSKATS